MMVQLCLIVNGWLKEHQLRDEMMPKHPALDLKFEKIDDVRSNKVYKILLGEDCMGFIIDDFGKFRFSVYDTSLKFSKGLLFAIAIFMKKL